MSHRSVFRFEVALFVGVVSTGLFVTCSRRDAAAGTLAADFQTPMQDGKRRIQTPGGCTTPGRETEGNIQVHPAVRLGKLSLPEAPVPTAEPDRFDTPPGVLRPPQLTLDVIELRESQLHVKGHTQPGVTMTVNGERIPVQGDGSFNEQVVLKRGATAAAVRAAGVNGATTEQQLPIIVPK